MKLRTPIILLLLTTLFTSCARFSVWQKATVIVTTAGAASTAILYSNYANAATSVAGGVGVGAVGSATSMIIDAVEATPSQINAAEEAGKRYLAALDAAALQKHAKSGKHLIAVRVPAGPKSRGQGTVMVYNTKKRHVENTLAYELRTLPKPGSSFRFESGEAEYVGVIPMIGSEPARTVLTPTTAPLVSKPIP